MANNNGWVAHFPFKRKNRWFNYLIIETKDQKIYIRKRAGDDIWKNLYEFVLWETGKLIPHNSPPFIDFIHRLIEGGKFTIVNISQPIKQQLTHQIIHGKFVHIRIEQPFPTSEYMLIKKVKLKEYPFPKLIVSYLQNPVQQLIQ